MDEKIPAHFIGFTSAEGWLDAIDRSRPVHAAPVHERHSSGHGLVVCVHTLLLAQIDGCGHVLYCRVPVDQYDSQNGLAPMFHEERHRHMGQSAWEVAQAWLKDAGLRAWHSVVAMPKDRKYLDGDAGFLRLDRERFRWVRAELATSAGAGSL